MSVPMGGCFPERQRAFHEAVLGIMRQNPESFGGMAEPEIGRVTEEVYLGSTRFECCLPNRSARFIGRVEGANDGMAYRAILVTVEVGGKNVFPDRRAP